MSILPGAERYRIVKFYWNSLDILFVVHWRFLMIELNNSTLLPFSQKLYVKKAINIIIGEAIPVYRDIHTTHNTNKLVLPYLRKNWVPLKSYLPSFSQLIFPRVFLRFFPCVYWKHLEKYRNFIFISLSAILKKFVIDK